jgi:hypothetical protein
MGVKFLLVLILALHPAAQPTNNLSLTIEVLRDVLVMASGAEKRGTLSLIGDRSESFTIKKGQRFQMMKRYVEGQCWIRFQNRDYDVASCPWLDGFSDQQEDIFKIVSSNGPRTKRAKPSQSLDHQSIKSRNPGQRP